MLKTFWILLKGVSEIDKTKLLQVSSDGPNVKLFSWKPSFKEKRRNLIQLLMLEHVDFMLSIAVFLRLVQKVVNGIFRKFYRPCGDF